MRRLALLVATVLLLTACSGGWPRYSGKASAELLTLASNCEHEHPPRGYDEIVTCHKPEDPLLDNRVSVMLMGDRIGQLEIDLTGDSIDDVVARLKPALPSVTTPAQMDAIAAVLRSAKPGGPSDLPQHVSAVRYPAITVEIEHPINGAAVKASIDFDWRTS